MTKPLSGILFALLLCVMGPAGAAPADDACAALQAARGKLLTMAESRRKSDLNALKRQVYASSAMLEGIVGSMTGADAAKAAAFRPTWEAFKATREKEILPALYKGRYDEARAIAHGIQAERMEKMKAALGCK